MVKQLVDWLLDRFFSVVLVLFIILGPLFSADITPSVKQAWAILAPCTVSLGLVVSRWIKWRKAP